MDEFRREIPLAERLGTFFTYSAPRGEFKKIFLNDQKFLFWIRETGVFIKKKAREQ